MDISHFTIESKDQLFQEFNTTVNGLSDTDVQKKLQKNGLNEIAAQRTHWWTVLLRQFTSPFLYLLIGAGILSIFLNERIDGIMILLFVLVNAVLGFYQEYRSEQTLKLLKKFIKYQSRVVRNGKETQIESSALVPGDILFLEAGDIVSADIRLIEENNLTVDESVLTGESVSVTKKSEPLMHSVNEMYGANNMCFSGTTIVTGKAKGVVVQTGKNTAIGEITKLTVETHRESSFEKSIAKFSTFVLYTILITLTAIFFINLFIKGFSIDIPDLLIFSIALAVSVIPEALPVVITFSLSRGALRLAKSKVLVKRLSAIEDLGSIEVLCTDKTGTLTENKLTYHTTYTKLPEVNLYAALASTLVKNKHQSVHSIDIALENSLSEKEKAEFDAYKRIQEIPFDPERKRNSMLVEKDKKYELIVKGAAEEIIPLCKNFTEEDKKQMDVWISEESGNRIIAIAKKEIAHPTENLLSEEKDLLFIGLLSFVDPIKKTAHEAVKNAKILGVQIKILTGDSREVAGSVAHQIGLIADKTKVITGDEFETLSFEKQHEAAIEYSVFARVSPQQKYKIIQVLQEKNEVGFLGEGINDAPALKIANVAIVVEGATDVAREAADIILLKKSLGVIINGIREGRETFANTSKYIKATLSSNFGNFYTVAVASLFINFLPLLPLQILLINLLTDFPMIAVATDTVDATELKSPRTYNIKEIALIGVLLGVVSSFFDFLFFALFVHISPGVLQTNWFIGSVLTELLFLFSIRTRLPLWKAQLPSKILIILTLVAFIITIVLPFTAIGKSIFSFVTPSISQLILILGIVVLYLIATETVKLLYYRFVYKSE